MHKKMQKGLTNENSSDILTIVLETSNHESFRGIRMNLMEALEGKDYIIQRIETDDEEMDAFLFSLGCYSG